MADPAAGAAEETDPVQLAELVAALSVTADLASGVTLEHGPADLPADHPAARPVLPGGLSPREAQVLGLLARGRSSRRIAAELGITQKTAGPHISHIYAKLGVSTRATAALFALEHGLLRA